MSLLTTNDAEFSGHQVSSTPAHVCAIIVTFNPDIALLADLIAAISAQVQNLIVVDNGSDRASRSALISLAGREPHRRLLLLDQNQGIAAAQNCGLRHSLGLGCTHQLLLDQDSIPAADMVWQLLLLERRLLASNIRVGAVGPTSVDRRTARRAGFVRKRGILIQRRFPLPRSGYVETDFLIASGMLIRSSALRAIGMMNEGYFIDHVDTEWCFRAAHHGFRLFGAERAVLLHSLGDRVMRVWLGRWRDVPCHSPLRNYYIFRNTLTMVRTAPMSLTWRLAHLYRLALFLTFFMLAGAPRGQRLRMMLLGLGHGLKGVTGPFDAVDS